MLDHTMILVLVLFLFVDNVFLLVTHQNTFYFIEVSWLSLCCFLEKQRPGAAQFIMDTCSRIVGEKFPFPYVSFIVSENMVWTMDKT